MKSKVFIVLAILLMGVNSFGVLCCEASITAKKTEGIKYVEVKNAVPVKILADYRKKGYSGVIDLGTFTHIDEKTMIAQRNKLLDGNATKAEMSKANCSLCIKPVMLNGERTVLYGRTMDLPNSYYPAYVFRVNEPGKYRSINIGYVHFGRETFDQIAETSTMDKEAWENIPYAVTDIMNEKGLLIETNMRDTYEAVNCTGTNPGKFRICSAILQRYLGDHCADIDDVLKTVNELDIFTAHSDYYAWHQALGIMDASGRYGILEFANNKVLWHEGHPGQTNFWIDPDVRAISLVDEGLGRWNTLMAGYNKIRTMEDMRKTMEKVYYSQLFGKDVCDMKFDPATEMNNTNVQGEIDKILEYKEKYRIKIDPEELAIVQSIADEQKKNNIRWDLLYLTRPVNIPKVYAVADFITHAMNQLPVNALKTSGNHECSVISYVVNNKERVYHVKFFEQNRVFHFGLDE